jgi:hypothetical protein
MSQPAAFRSVGNAVGDAPNRYAPPFGPLGVKWARVDWFAPHVNEGYGHIAGDGDVFCGHGRPRHHCASAALYVSGKEWSSNPASITSWLESFVRRTMKGGTYWSRKDQTLAPVWLELTNEPYIGCEGWSASPWAKFVADVVPRMRAANRLCGCSCRSLCHCTLSVTVRRRRREARAIGSGVCLLLGQTSLRLPMRGRLTPTATTLMSRFRRQVTSGSAQQLKRRDPAAAPS